jgi:adenosylhomocysteine nucleosidase
LSLTGVVAALEFEARCLGTRRRRSPCLSRLGDGSLIAVSGVGVVAAAQAAHTLIAAGAEALLSWGVAGALDPAVGCGTAVLPAAVLRQGTGLGSSGLQHFETYRPWRERLLAALAGHAAVVSGALLTTAMPVAAAALKATLFHDTGAVAVDMESAAVAEVAAKHGLPFIALRVVLDTAGDSVPASLLQALESPAAERRGRSRAWPLLWPLLRSPAHLRLVLRLAIQYRHARGALSDCARLGRPTRVIDSPGQR